MKRRKIVLEIERLVLHGVPAAQTRALVAGMERELGQLLRSPSARSALAGAPAHRERVDARRPSGPFGNDGRAVARAVYQGLTGGKKA
jgi:hypothetical protein